MDKVTVMVHAPSSRVGLDWYQKAFPDCLRCTEEVGSFEYLTIGTTHLEVVPADHKVPSGAAGTVVYWHTNDFEKRLDYLLSIGATLYRGPMVAENGLQMCQVLDPFGNPVGIRCQKDIENTLMT